jgi:GlpG protein
MRLIGTLQNENDARRLASHLTRKGISNNCDVAFDAQSGHMSYQLWVLDEDRLNEAQGDFDQFLERPSNAAFDTPITEQIPTQEDVPASEEAAIRPRVRTPFTTFIISLCTLIFILNFFEEYPMVQGGLTDQTALITPIQALLLFDLPPAIEELEKVIAKHKIPPEQKVENLSPEIQAELSQIEKIPYWRGVYEWFLLKVKGQDTSVGEGPFFQRIRQGEVWRLFSPDILHRDLLHILFNMIWVWVLSRPIELRIGITRLLLLSLIAGIGSNIAQYLMSGPFFIGYSGVVMGLAGFTWMRERIAPWEGYPLNRSTILFLLIFIGGMFLLQFSSFILQLFTNLHFEPNIANTAHIVGALIGAALGRLPYFAMRVAR